MHEEIASEERKANEQRPNTRTSNVKPLSSFIQSALKQSQSSEPGNTKHISRNRKSKKLKLSTRKLVCNPWPGEEEELITTEDVDIGVYSDNSDSGSDNTVGDCCEIEEYQDDMPHGEHQLAAGSTAGGPSSSGELCPTASGPVTAVEREDSDDIHSTSPESPNTCTLAALSPVQEQLQIEDPPSSPESPLLDGNRTKASEWLLQVQPHSVDDVCAPRTPHETDSAKKSRCNRFVSLGLAERLSTIIKRENAEVAFFEHQTTTTQNDEILGSRQQLSIKILSLVNTYSLFVGTGKLLAATTSIPECSKPELKYPSNTVSVRCGDQGYSTPQKAVGNQGNSLGSAGDQPQIIAVFSPKTAGNLNLRVGSHVKIYSPWQCIVVGQLDVILCPHFCEAVGFSPVKGEEVSSPAPCRLRGVDGMSPLFHSAKVTSPLGNRVPCEDVATGRLLSKSEEACFLPMRSNASSSLSNESISKSLAPTRLFSKFHEETGSLATVCNANGARPSLIGTSQEESGSVASEKYPSLLEAIETGRCGVISFSAFVVRIYRRRMSITNQQSKLEEVKDVIRTGEGRRYQIINVGVHRRATLSRAPEIFNLISYLKFHRIIAQTLKSDQEEVASPQGGVPSLYVLKAQQCSTVVADGMQTIQFAHQLPLPLHSPSMGYADLLAKVVYTYHKESDDSCSQPDRYMFIVLPCLGSQSALVRVSLRPSYCLNGLLRVLKTPGAGVLLRDIEVCSNGSYSMNMCSLLLPVDAELLDPNGIYPQKSFDACELQLVASIRPPVLPPLTLATPIGSLVSVSGSIAGVDEENAYSWMACNSCGCTKLVPSEVDGSQNHSNLHCSECEKLVSSPAIHLQLAVFVSHPEFKDLKIHVELLQTTIQQLLPITTSNLDEGFDVHLILNKGIVLKSCYILEVKHTADGTILQLEEVDAFTELYCYM